MADYKIPQAEEKDAEIPKNDKGEDIGIGDGWWYKGLFSHAWTISIANFIARSRNDSYVQHLGTNYFSPHVAADRATALLSSGARADVASTSYRPFLSYG